MLTLADQIEDSAWTQEGWDYRPERVVPIIIAFIAAEFQRGRAQAEQERDAGYQRGDPYTVEQQLHDQKRRNKDLERRIREELEPQAAELRSRLAQITQALQDIVAAVESPAIVPRRRLAEIARAGLTGAQA